MISTLYVSIPDFVDKIYILQSRSNHLSRLQQHILQFVFHVLLLVLIFKFSDEKEISDSSDHQNLTDKTQSTDPQEIYKLQLDLKKQSF